MINPKHRKAFVYLITPKNGEKYIILTQAGVGMLGRHRGNAKVEKVQLCKVERNWQEAANSFGWASESAKRKHLRACKAYKAWMEFESWPSEVKKLCREQVKNSTANKLAALYLT